MYISEIIFKDSCLYKIRIRIKKAAPPFDMYTYQVLSCYKYKQTGGTGDV